MGNQSASSRAQFGRPALLGKEEGGTGRWFYFLEEKGGGGGEERGAIAHQSVKRASKVRTANIPLSKKLPLKINCNWEEKKEGTVEESARFIRGVLHSPSSCVNVT